MADTALALAPGGTSLASLLSDITLNESGELADPDALVRVMAWLVARNTDSSTDPKLNQPTLAVMREIADALRQFGIACEVVEETNPELVAQFGRQASLAFRVGKEGVSGGMAVVGHLDTVPPGDLAAWGEFNPRALTEKDGELYGLGASDMKGAIATMLAVAVLLARRADHLTTPFYGGLTWGEEVGPYGVPALMKGFEALGAQPEIALVPESEGTDHLVLGHRGCVVLEFTLTGPHAPLHALELVAQSARLQDILEREHTYREADFDPPYPTLNPASATTDAHGTTTLRISYRAATPENVRFIREYFEDALGALQELPIPETEMAAHRFTFTGISGHSSEPKSGVNALTYAARLALLAREEGATPLTVSSHNEDGVIPGAAVLELAVPPNDPDVLERVKAHAETLALEMQAYDPLPAGRPRPVGIIHEASEERTAILAATPTTARMTVPLDVPYLPTQDAQSLDVQRISRVLAGALGVTPRAVTESGAADAGPLSAALPNTMVCEWFPGNGTANGIHGPGEHLAREDLMHGFRGVWALAADYSGLDFERLGLSPMIILATLFAEQKRQIGAPAEL